MQRENLWCVCNYMASPKSTVTGFQKLAKELRDGELWWYHFGHPDMPVERIHPSRRMLLPCKPLPFVGPLRRGEIPDRSGDARVPDVPLAFAAVQG